MTLRYSITTNTLLARRACAHARKSPRDDYIIQQCMNRRMRTLWIWRQAYRSANGTPCSPDTNPRAEHQNAASFTGDKDARANRGCVCFPNQPELMKRAGSVSVKALLGRFEQMQSRVYCGQMFQVEED